VPTGGRGSMWKECDMKIFVRMLKDQSGASAAEYALILAIIGAAVAIAAVTLGGAIGKAMDNASNCINGANSACTATPAS
jgi:pilus assembly protein Flp/PilA